MGYCRAIAFLKNPVLLTLLRCPWPASLQSPQDGVSSSPTTGVCEARPRPDPKGPIRPLSCFSFTPGTGTSLARQRLRNKSSLIAGGPRTLQEVAVLFLDRALPAQRSPHAPAHGHLSEPRKVQGAEQGRGCRLTPTEHLRSNPVAKHPRCERSSPRVGITHLRRSNRRIFVPQC